LFPLQALALDASDFNPTGYWTCDEESGVRYDSVVGGANDFTAVNSVGFASGALNYACDFEETSSQYLTTNNDFDYTSGTICAWFFAETVRVSSYSPELISTGTNSGNGGFTLRYSFVNQEFNFFFGAGSAVYVESTTVITAGDWYHVCAVWTPSVATIYVNGTSESTDSGGGTLTAGTASMRVGTGPTLTTRYYDGLVDEIFIADYDLAGSDISDLYNGGSPLPYIDIAPSSGSILLTDMNGTTTCTTNASGTTCVNAGYDYTTLVGEAFVIFIMAVVLVLYLLKK